MADKRFVNVNGSMESFMVLGQTSIWALAAHLNEVRRRTVT